MFTMPTEGKVREQWASQRTGKPTETLNSLKRNVAMKFCMKSHLKISRYSIYYRTGMNQQSCFLYLWTSQLSFQTFIVESRECQFRLSVTRPRGLFLLSDSSEYVCIQICSCPSSFLSSGSDLWSVYGLQASEGTWHLVHKSSLTTLASGEMYYNLPHLGLNIPGCHPMWNPQSCLVSNSWVTFSEPFSV